MNFYFATVVWLDKNGQRSEPFPYTIKAQNAFYAEEKLREWLGPGRYEISVAETIGYGDED